VGCSSRIEASNTSSALDIRFYLAEETANKGLIERCRPDSDQKIYLHPEPIVRTQDIIAASKAMGEFGQPVLMVSLNGSASERLFEATKQHINKPAAIEVDGDIVVVATLRAALSHGFHIVAGWDAETIDAMLKKLKQ